MSKRKAKAEQKFWRTPWETGPPFGWSNLLTRVPPDAAPGSYEARRLFEWRDDHPKDVLVRPALTGPLPEYEVGLRAAISGLSKYDLPNDLGQATWRRWERYRNPPVRYVRRRSSASST